MKTFLIQRKLPRAKSERTPGQRATRTVTQILKAAYRRHARDLATRLAVKHCLR